MIKAILMYTAQPIAGFNMFEQGAGQLNLEGAIKLARIVRTDLTNSTPLGTALLTTVPPVPQSSIAGQNCYWSQGILTNYTYVTGTDLITKYQKVYGTGILLSDGLLIANGILLANTTMMSDGIQIGDGVLTSNGILLADGTLLLASGILLADGILLSDGLLVSDGMLTGDGILLGDAQLQAMSATLGGENTAAMPIVRE
jgi:hypothetical protein